MKIGVLTLHTHEIKVYGEIACRNKQAYCQQHGYSLIVAESRDPSRPAAWMKIPLLQKHLPDFDWMFWTDADSLITNREIPLEAFINPWSDLIITRDGNHINAGEYFIRNCEWSFQFLAEVWAQQDLIHHGWWEQAAMIRLYPKHYHHFSILPPRAFNSFESNWHPGDFIIHFPATSTAYRHDRMRTFEAYCLDESCPPSLRIAQRGDFPGLLNRLNLIGEAVEVGVTRGCFARHILDQWEGKRLHLVDAWRNLPGYPSIDNVNDEEHERRYRDTLARLAGLEDRFLVHRCLSSEAASRFESATLDFVYLDANHRYDAVQEDLSHWYPKLRHGGILAGHDFLDGNLPAGEFGVRSAVLDFASRVGARVFHTYEMDWPSWYLIK